MQPVSSGIWTRVTESSFLGASGGVMVSKLD